MMNRCIYITAILLIIIIYLYITIYNKKTYNIIKNKQIGGTCAMLNKVSSNSIKNPPQSGGCGGTCSMIGGNNTDKVNRRDVELNGIESKGDIKYNSQNIEDEKSDIKNAISVYDYKPTSMMSNESVETPVSYNTYNTDTVFIEKDNNTSLNWMSWKRQNNKFLQKNPEYRITNGYYSNTQVTPGYSSNINTYNTDNIDKLSKNVLYNNIFEEQVGGGDSEYYEDPNKIRTSGLVYSGDIINILSGNNILQRGLINSQISMKPPLEDVKTNLCKVRIVLENTDISMQTPIKYGDVVNIMHNALINNANESRYIKYGDRLQSHQSGQLYRSYKIYNQKNTNSTDYIKYDDQIIICRGDQEGENIFLHIENDGSISATSTINEASVFELSLIRVFELYNKNLCICDNEIIYP